MTVVPLGISSAVPTRTRHLSSTALLSNGRILLFDCGEGTQMRLMHGGLRHSRIDAVFISHVHGDHYFGLMGLMSTMVLARRRAPLVVVAPEELIRVIDLVPGVRSDELTFPVEYVSLRDGQQHAVVYKTRDLQVEARALDHRVYAVGYRVQETGRSGHLDVQRARALGLTDFADYRALKQGRKVYSPLGHIVTPDMVLDAPPIAHAFAYVADTRPCEGAVVLAREAAILMHEATFADALRHRAGETGHSTAAQAAEVARKARAKRLLLVHFSSRYRDISPLVAEAREIFPATYAAEELQRYPLKNCDHAG